MNPTRSRGWLRQSLAAVVSAALVLSAFAPGTAALAAEVNLGRAVESGASGGQAGAVRALASLPAPLTLPTFAAAPLAPALSLPAGALPDIGGHAPVQAVQAAPSLRPAAAPALLPAAAVAAPAEGPLSRMGQWINRAVGRGQPAVPGDAPAAVPAQQESATDAKARADESFRSLTGEAASPRRADLAEPVVAAQPSSRSPRLAVSRRLAGLATAEAKAQSSLKGRAEHLRLLRVSVDLRSASPRWTFAYHAPAKGQILTKGPKGAESRRVSRNDRPAMLRQEEVAAADLDRDLAALKAVEPSFRAVRAELLPKASGGSLVVFYDAAGRSRKAPAVEAVPAPAPSPLPVPESVASEPAAPEVPSAPAAAEPKTDAKPQETTKYIHENFLGWRSVHGVRHTPGLGRLPLGADASRIIDQIAGQFGFSRAQVLELGRKFRLEEVSPREDWLAVYDRLQAVNRDHFKRLDSKKYDGWKSFRELVNQSYPPGWRGALLRLSELHKHFFGAAIRFPYHLFDMFVFGYFRQAIAFEFFHSTEDFLVLAKDKDGKAEKDLAKKWLEASMRQQAFDGSGAFSGLRSQSWFRQADRWFLTPLAKPLATFVVRRMTLAVMSAVAMGLLGAFAPALPLSFALTSIPILGPALVAALNGLPVLTAAVPLVGHALAPVVSAAVGALVKDLVLGPLLNTLILTTLLTFPNAARENLAKARDMHPLSSLSLAETASALGKTAVSWEFWKANLKSFAGMATVGAEIEGIMTYAGRIDAAIDPGFETLFGRKLGVFEAIGSAVERPKGESSIPFGGAITWGNVLIFKLQEASGIHISEMVMGLTLSAKSVLGLEGAMDGAIARAPAATVVHAASERGPEGKFPFDPDLWTKSPAEVEARIKQLSGSAGGLDAEIASVKAHQLQLRAQLGDSQAKLDLLKKDSHPITPEERSEYERLLGELTSKRDQAYVQSKLAEKSDVTNPTADGLAELRRLKALKDKYMSVLPPPPANKDGYWQELASREASYKALASRLDTYANGPRSEGRATSDLDPGTRRHIEELVSAIEGLRTEVRAEMTQRDATQNLLQAANRMRNKSLDARRDGKDMLRFHTDMAKLATVMDLALSLNEIGAAQAAINQMIAALEAKRAGVAQSQTSNQQGQQGADANRAQLDGWRADAQKTLDDDGTTQSDIVSYEAKAGMAAQRITSFQTDASAYITQVNAADKGASADALTEYQRRLDLLAQIQRWRDQGGNPNDPNAFSMKKFNDYLVEVQDNITKAQDGLNRLPTVPVEFAGVLVAAVPGPEVSVTNPTREQTLQILSDRRSYWQAKKVDFADALSSVQRMLDPGNTASVTDEFGDAHPESLPRWRSQSSQDLASAQSAARQYLSQLDALAANLNRTTGSNIPMLSGLSLKDLQDAIKTYGDSLRAVKFPAGDDSLAMHTAKMDLITAAKLVPYSAREVIRWSKADATITAIDDATANVLPGAQAGLTNIVRMMDDILADVDADVAFMNTGAGGGQALIDRKTVLLRDKVMPALRGAEAMLRDDLIPYQRKSIEQAAPGNSDLFKLYDSKKTLMTEAVKLYQKTLPWALATYGAAEGDQAAARANIADWRATLQKKIDGYDDAKGHHKGVAEYQVEMAHRKDPNYTGTEVIYGESQPYSLPKKIDKYNAEKAQRAAEINTQDAQINEIMGKIETISKGKYNLSAFRLPTGVGTDAASVARVQAVVDAHTIPNLGDEFKRIADDASASASALNIGGGGNGTVPSGTQPPITVSDNQQIALLALEAVKRLVPTSLAQPDSAPAAYALARFLFSDAYVAASQDALTNQVPKAEVFLQHAAQALGNSIAASASDDAYATSNGTAETPESVYSRKVADFSALDAFLLEGVQFYNLKVGWDNATFGTIDKVQSYYDSLHDIYAGGQTANTNEAKAIDSMEEALRKTYQDLEDKRVKVTAWLSQLNPKEESALRRVGDDISRIQEKTRDVLEKNIDWHQQEDQLRRSQEIIRAKLTEVDGQQQQLAALLADPALQDKLPAGLVRRIEDLRLGRSAWTMGSAKDQTEALVVKKSEYTAFLDALLGIVTQGSQALSHQDLAAIKSGLLQNPQGLSSFIPGATVADFGDTADGFYLVYQSKFSVPNGLETGTWVSLGNVAKAWGNNVSVNGYQFASPPSDDGTNAPYGDKGVEVQVESLQGQNWVNYLNVDFHRFGLDIPKDNAVVSNAMESRLMVFDDFAMMLMGDKLYVGLAGFGDVAMSDRAGKPYYYGGSAKTSLKLTEVMKLNAEQQVIFAKDPRKFLQDVNLDFTGYDESLNQNYRITAEGARKYYSRTQVGPSFDINRLLHPEGGGDTFTVDLFYAKTAGTDDVNQQSGGVTVLKGFSIKDDQGREWLRIDNRLTAEKGAVANTLGDKLSFTFPDKGIVLSAEGRIVGGQSNRYAELSKRMGDHATIGLGYGSQYIGQNDRLSITMNTSFTLGELWQAVADNSAENLRGGATLKNFNKQMDDFFTGDPARGTRTAAELSKVFEQDVARRLISQDIGVLTREIQDLRKAGAIMDNTRVRGMVGFTSRAVSNDTAELATGGGFTVGTYTDLTLTKTQKALIESKTASIYREGLRLQDRLLDLTKQWQAAVVDLAQSQWDTKLANFEVQNAPNESLRREADVRLLAATDHLRQALLKYNSLAGRDLSSGSPFDNLSSEDLRQLMGNLRSLIAAPDRFARILGGLDEAELRKSVGDNPVNLMDWLPWVDRLTVGFGVQYQDMMANQVLTLGGSVRLPIYDPASKSADKAYVLEGRAAREEMAQAYEARRLAASAEAERARAWQASAAAIEDGAPRSAQRLSDAIRAYRNGLMGPADLHRAFEDWRWYSQGTFEAQSQAALASAQAAADRSLMPESVRPSGPANIASLDDAFALASRNSHGLQELALRSQAADEMSRAADHRVQKFWLDINVGMGLTAQGLGWIPSIGITGIPVTPVFGFELKPEELRELQVRQHDRQKDYYDALKDRLEAGLAIQFYQNITAYRSAQERLEIFRDLIPSLEAAAASGGVPAGQKLDAARLEREKANLALRQSRATLNLLLGRDENAPLEVSLDREQAFAALSALLASKDLPAIQRRILDARVKTARAVEEMVDKNLKVEMLQLEPVSLVVRSLGRLIGALSDEPIYNTEHAAAARIEVLNEERAQEAYDGQRQQQIASLRLQLDAAQSRLSALAQRADAQSRLDANALRASVLSLRAGLLALGADSVAASKTGSLPTSWAALTRSLAEAEQSLAPLPSSEGVEVPMPETAGQRSAAYLRYYHARQTLGHQPIDKDFIEGWIEIRLKDPSTPPQVLLALAKLREDKAERLYRTDLVGASARADVLSAQFASDVNLLRWLDKEVRTAGAQSQKNLAETRLDVTRRLGAQGDRIVALLGLPTATTVDDLARLVPEDTDAAAGPTQMSEELIKDIRVRQLDSVRRTLFEGGLPSSLGSEDSLMQQIKANTIAERMSYKGFTPVLAAGLFRGQSISGVFMEAPDPREIERGLENVMSEVLRKDLESSGRIKELSLHLQQLMVTVSDGAKQLEARRRQIEAAEGDLRARAALVGEAGGMAEFQASQERLVRAWADFSATMVETKSAFITLVSELQALGEGETGTLRPLKSHVARDVRMVRRDAETELLDFWTERLADPAFEAASDALLAKTGPSVPAAARARVLAAARAYRESLLGADGVRTNSFSDAERMNLLMRNDAEGHRLALRAALVSALGGLGTLDPHTGPAAGEIIRFFRAEAEKAASQGQIDRAQKRAVTAQLRETFWRAMSPSPRVEAAFVLLEAREKALDEAREALMTDYLSNADDDATRFILKDLRLDAYLKAQKSFDAQLTAMLESPDFTKDPALARVLDGLHDVRASLERAASVAKYGRGMAALDALIMLEQTRLRGARWAGRPPTEVDRIAEALQTLEQTRQRWTSGKTELQPLYAVTVMQGDSHTWSVDTWLTAEEFAKLRETPSAPGGIAERGGRFFIDKAADGSSSKFEVIGGVDIAEAVRQGAADSLKTNSELLALGARMKDSDFVALGGPVGQTTGFQFDQVFGKQGLHAQGRLFFFNAEDGAALNPMAALSRPPESVIVMAYTEGQAAPSRDRFPNLLSLRQSDEAKDFRKLAFSPSGAQKLADAAKGYQAEQLRRGWIEVQLNSFGFARDEKGRVVQLYRTQDDFEAQWKSFDHAERDLSEARKVLEVAQAELGARQADAAQAKTDFESATRSFQNDRESKAAKKAFDRASKPLKEAGDRLRSAQARAVNAAQVVRDAEADLAHSKVWTLYRTGDLVLGLDAQESVVRASAHPARGTAALDEALAGGGAQVKTIQGPLAAAVVDAAGRLRRVYATPEDVDRAAASWKMRSFSPGQDVDALTDDGRVRTKVRFSHYVDIEGKEELPVLLSSRYLLERLDDSKSQLKSKGRWALMPYNWGNIILEIPRSIVQAPAEIIGGRDPRSQHYLGRANMYKTEGGETERHGFLRSALGVIDILDLLPDPVDRFYDPSQFPEAVRVGSALKPGESLFSKDPVDVQNDKSVHFGVQSLSRSVRYAAEDLDAARQRTLARFTGGVEQTDIETRRGRGRLAEDGKTWLSGYQESSVKVRSGFVPSQDEGVVSATPGALFVDRIERRVKVYPGAAGYEKQAAAMDGYGQRVADQTRTAQQVRAGLEAAQAQAERDRGARLVERDAASAAERDIWMRWHRLAERIGAQEALERRIAEMESSIKALQGRIAWWDRYLRRLEEARRGEGGPVVPGKPWSPNPMFWVWMAFLFGLGALIAALWHAFLRRPRTPRPA